MARENREEKKAKKEELREESPRVHVFGDEYGPRKRHFHSGNITWGVLILFAGIVLLLNSLNIVPWQFWNYVWMFWPALFVLIGIHVILGNNIVSRFVTLVIAVIIFIFIILYGLLQVHSPLIQFIPKDLLNSVLFFNSLKR